MTRLYIYPQGGNSIYLLITQTETFFKGGWDGVGLVGSCGGGD